MSHSYPPAPLAVLPFTPMPDYVMHRPPPFTPVFTPHVSAWCHPPVPALLQCLTAIVINSWESCIPTHPFLPCMLIFCSFCSLPSHIPCFQIPCSDLAQRHYSVHKDEWFCLGKVLFKHNFMQYAMGFALSKYLQMVVNMGRPGCTHGGYVFVWGSRWSCQKIRSNGALHH